MPKADAVFEGGGVKGIALVGALQAFEEAGFEWENVAGTSAGAITAALVAVGYKAHEVKDIMEKRINFSKFMDSSGIEKLPKIGPIIDLITGQGMFKGDYFLGLMRELIEEKKKNKHVTFKDLLEPKHPEDSDVDYETKYKYKLRVIASDITGKRMLTLPQDIDTLGGDPDDLEVATAVRMSMSIPFFFKPVRFGEGAHRNKKHWIVDGGMLSNFPIWLFDSSGEGAPEWPTIGFLLWEAGSGQPQYQKIDGLISMAKGIVETLSGAIDRMTLREIDLDRVVKIPTRDIAGTDFNLTDEIREWLYNSGYEAAKEFLSTWTFDEYRRKRTGVAA